MIRLILNYYLKTLPSTVCAASNFQLHHVSNDSPCEFNFSNSQNFCCRLCVTDTLGRQNIQPIRDTVRLILAVATRLYLAWCVRLFGKNAIISSSSQPCNDHDVTKSHTLCWLGVLVTSYTLAPAWDIKGGPRRHKYNPQSVTAAQLLQLIPIIQLSKARST